MTDKRRFGRQNRCVLASLDSLELSSHWTKAQRCYRNIKGCWIWQGSTQNGYPSVSRGHAKSKVKIHMLALYMATGQLPEPREVSSHLCHNKLCINPDHLVIESIVANSRRNGCICSMIDDRGNQWNLCPHEPRCLRRDTANLNGFTPTIIE